MATFGCFAGLAAGAMGALSPTELHLLHLCSSSSASFASPSSSSSSSSSDYNYSPASSTPQQTPQCHDEAQGKNSQNMQASTRSERLMSFFSIA